ncbi:glycoside hydrolase family 95 protein [Puteibacter caeruleilacunae]|nr:glycoside hydrolase family 95 protein [Puteibacter caeruleilacunae]
MKITSLIVFACVAMFLISCNKHDEYVSKQNLKLWYNKPAKDWFEALPQGNGRLGLMLFGSANGEHLQLNEESLWAGCPENPYPENVKEHYAKFQQLNLDGKYSEALAYALEHLTCLPTSFRSYEPLGDLFLKFGHKDVTDYKRELDLETGLTTVSYNWKGNSIKRESFVSEKYDAIFYHFKSEGEDFSKCAVTFDRAKDASVAFKDGMLNIDGQIFDDPDGFDDNAGGSGKGGKHMRFNAQVNIIPDEGDVEAIVKGLRISNTKEFTLILSAKTDYNLSKLNFDRSIDPEQETSAIVAAASVVNYEDAKREHIERHASIMNRVKLKLSGDSIDNIPTDERIANLKAGNDDRHMTELMFQYGRYLLLGSSGGKAVLPANLQGLWSKDMWAAWESDYHLNINLQMNYWPADVCNLSETFEPLDDYMMLLADAGKETAKRFIDSEGWCAHHAANVFGRTTPSGSTASSQINNGYCFPLAGAWMSLSLWRHYQFNQDEQYLKETVYPIIKGATRFILDFLVENKDGQLVTAPSYSPENTYFHPKTGARLRNTVASTMDIQIIREVFSVCVNAEHILGVKGLSKEIKLAAAKLPEMKIGEDGTIQEWIEDYEEVEPGHRHISHLFGLYPSIQISRTTPELFEAAKKTLARRLSEGGGQTGWSRAWLINFYARFEDGDECLKHVNSLIANQCTPTLLDLHPPKIFQIDGNLGATAGVAEMLVQSQERGVIRLLPALPKAWKDGSVEGLKARGNFEVSIAWANNQVTTAKIKAVVGGKVTVFYNGKSVELDLKPGEVYEIR